MSAKPESDPVKVKQAYDEAFTFCMATFNPCKHGTNDYDLWNKGAIAAFVGSPVHLPDSQTPSYIEGREWGANCQDPISWIEAMVNPRDRQEIDELYCSTSGETLIEEKTTKKGFCFAAMWRKNGDSDESWGFGATEEEAKEDAFYFREDEGSGQSLGWGQWSVKYQTFDLNGHTVQVEQLLKGTTVIDAIGR